MFDEDDFGVDPYEAAWDAAVADFQSSDEDWDAPEDTDYEPFPGGGWNYGGDADPYDEEPDLAAAEDVY